MLLNTSLKSIFDGNCWVVVCLTSNVEYKWTRIIYVLGLISLLIVTSGAGLTTLTTDFACLAFLTDRFFDANYYFYFSVNRFNSFNNININKKLVYIFKINIDMIFYVI